ncbi:hypothetical protein [Synechocystis salina]|uniref:hypothetical protein n=1 Tax=Synechocystis salina TaxID=945780 RepID=UPI001D13A6A1|nr:hypothetical protein [Synechocystis salina]
MFKFSLQKLLGALSLFLVTIGIIVAILFLWENSLASPTKIRGVWLTNVDSNVLYDPAQLKTAIAT